MFASQTPCARAQRRLGRAGDGRPGREPVAGGPERDVVPDLPGVEPARHICQIADHLELRGQGRKCIGVIRLVIAAVIDELVNRRVDVTVGNLVQRAHHEMPVRIEVVLDP